MVVVNDGDAGARKEKLAWAEDLLRRAEEKAGLRGPGVRMEREFAPRSEGECGLAERLGVSLGSGVSVGVSGSTSLLLALVGLVAGQGRWVAVVGMPSLGLAAVHEYGIDLERVLLVPDPGGQSANVLAALIDGFDVVVVGGEAALTAGQRRSLVGRVRRRGAVMFTPLWPEVSIKLEAAVLGWEGVWRGGGYLRERRISVTRVGWQGQNTVRLAPGVQEVARAQVAGGQGETRTQGELGRRATAGRGALSHAG